MGLEEQTFAEVRRLDFGSWDLVVISVVSDGGAVVECVRFFFLWVLFDGVFWWCC